MTVGPILIGARRVDAVSAVAKDKLRRLRHGSYNHAMLEAEEVVAALEILGVIKFETADYGGKQ